MAMIPGNPVSRRSLAAFSFATVLAAAPAASQVRVQTPTLSMVTDCINQAINVNKIYISGEEIQFVCEQLAAKTLYDRLGRLSAETMPWNNGDKTFARPFEYEEGGPGEPSRFSKSRCQYAYEDAYGNSKSTLAARVSGWPAGHYHCFDAWPAEPRDCPLATS
jgi:hypothetical protein